MSKNPTLSKLLIFAVGAAIGSAVTWKFVKTKYERIAQEEIDSVKEVFSKRAAEDDQLDELANAANDAIEKMNKQLDIRECAAIIQREGYTDYTKEKDVKGVANNDRPYVIEPEDYDTLDGYDAMELTYFGDKVLAHYNGEIIDEDEADEMIGLESLEKIGEYENDAVHVRNDSMECDFEVLLDLRNYSDVFKNGPLNAGV